MAEIERENITLKNFTDLSDETLKELLNWRNHLSIRSKMKSSGLISEEEHFSFVESLKKSKKSYYWLAIRKKIEIGTVYLHLNENKKEGEWGYYLAPEFIGSGFGLELGYESICIFFEEFKIKQLNGYVKLTNKENSSLQEILNFKLKKDKVDGLLHYYMSESDFNTLSKTYTEFKKTLFQ